MPISIVAGAQYGSEGKGKIAFEWAQRSHANAVVRVGGPNSGHTVIDAHGSPVVFRQLPTAALLPNVMSVLTPGSYIDLDVLSKELSFAEADPTSVCIDPRAVIVTHQDRTNEQKSGLTSRIGSTGSGTGSAVARRVSRDGSLTRASDIPELQPYLRDTLPYLRHVANTGRLIIEGTQGYGLSLLHGQEGDFSTSRDTTAAGFLSETGLSPLDVDEIVLVARAFPIRVAGNSGSLRQEISWAEVGARTGLDDLKELTTVTQKVRRVGEFDPDIVLRAIAANRPTHLVMNHLDYVAKLDSNEGQAQARQFICDAEEALDRRIDFVGTGRSGLTEAQLAFC